MCVRVGTQSPQVDVDLSLTAHANARKYYEGKKKAAEKKEKTISMTDQAYRAAEKKTRVQMHEVKSKATINALRKVHRHARHRQIQTDTDLNTNTHAHTF